MKLVSGVNNCIVISRWTQQMLALLVLLILVQMNAKAGAVALYGFDYVEVRESSIEAEPGGLEQPLPDNADYDQQLEQLETDAGPYADGLSEPLASLARYHLEQGDFSQALTNYRRAIHVVRINDGLYHPRQIPLVRNLLSVYRRSGDMVGLDESYEYFFRLYGSARPPYTDIRMKATLEYLRWQREATVLGLDDTPARRLQAAYRLNQEVLEALGSSVAVSYHWYRDLVVSQLRNLYLLQAQVPEYDDSYVLTQPAAAMSSQSQLMNFDQQRLTNLRRNSFSNGRLLLEQLVHRAGLTRDSVALAAAWLESGDWYQFNSNRRSAVDAYTAAIVALEGEDEETLLSEWFDQPVALPATMLLRSPNNPKTAESRRLTADYEVDSRGYARNVQVHESGVNPGNEAARLRRLLSSTRFRPRYVAGSAVSSEGVQRDYELLGP
ncbi:MAG: hypothetical protein V7746_11645 [Halioglobus sp.]